MLRGVIFDLFHTLTGLESEWSNLPWTSDVLGIDRRSWDDVLIRRSRWRLCGEERDPYTIVRRLAHEVDASIPEDRIREALEIRIRRFRDSLLRVPAQNIAALKRLRESGLRLGLVSNADVMEVAAWAESPLAGCFDAEIFSCHAGAVKPEPAIFEQCLDAMGLPAADCLFVGDGGSDELTGAKRVGLSTVSFPELCQSFGRREWPSGSRFPIITLFGCLKFLPSREFKGAPRLIVFNARHRVARGTLPCFVVWNPMREPNSWL